MDIVIKDKNGATFNTANKYCRENIDVKVQTDTITAKPTVEEQSFDGLYRNVIVEGDANLLPENIKEGAEIFGVQGIAKATDVEITDGTYLFYEGKRTDNLNGILKLCDNIVDCTSMFYNATNLTNLDLKELNTSKVTSMVNMFSRCNGLTSLDISNFDTSQVINMSRMFETCSKLVTFNIRNFNTSEVTNMQGMFCWCQKLETLDISNFDTSKVTSMYQMFYYCPKLQKLDLSNFNTSKTTTMAYMFEQCYALTDLDISSFDFSLVKDITNMIHNDSNLVNLKFGKNLGKAYTVKAENHSYYTLKFPYSRKLTHESLMSVINGLYDLNLTYDVANGGTLYRQSLQIGSENLAKLTADEIKIATDKGWNVS